MLSLKHTPNNYFSERNQENLSILGEENLHLRLAKLEAERTKVVLETQYLKSPSLARSNVTSNYSKAPDFTTSNFKEDQNLGKKKKYKPAKGKRSFFKRKNKNGKEYFYWWNEKLQPQEGRQLSRYPEFKELLPREQKLILLFYKKRGHSTLSLNEMAKLFNCTDASAMKWRDKLIKKGLVKTEKRFLKNKDGTDRKYHARSYTYLTTKGGKWLKALLGEFFKTVFKEDLESSTQDQQIPGCKKGQISFRGVGHKGLLCNKECQGELLSSSRRFSSEEDVSSVEAEEKSLSKNNNQPGDLEGEAYHRYLESCLDSDHHQKNEEEKNKETSRLLKTNKNSNLCSSKNLEHLEEIFTRYGLSKQLQDFHPKALAKLSREDPKTIEKNLKLIREKYEKGFRIQSFVKFFTYLMKTSKKGKGAKKWFGKLADDYSDALEGKTTPGTKRLYDGKTTSTIISSLSQLEKETGKKLTRKNMDSFVRQDTNKLKTALNHVFYYMKLGKVRLKKEQTQRKGSAIYQEEWIMKQVKVFNPKIGKEEVREMKTKQRILVGHRLVEVEAKAPISKGVPIFAEKWCVKIIEVFSPKAGGNITKEVREKKQVLIGHRVVVPMLGSKEKPKQSVRSWIGLLSSTLKLSSIEAIMELRLPWKQRTQLSVAGS
jgi:DNA-binding MarR family transcriptional regulator